MERTHSKPPFQIKKTDTVSIISHIRPDGDSIGSTLALGLALKKICDNVHMYFNDQIPKKYCFLPGINEIQTYNMETNQYTDFCFVLDCGDTERLGYSDIILNNTHKIVNIDHHITNTNFGDINIIDFDASSTCEIIFALLNDIGISVDDSIATCLYTGIVTDTGNFIYDNTTPKTHKIVAKLLACGVNINKIAFNLYQNKDPNFIKFLGHVLNKIEISDNGKIAILTILMDDLKKYKLNPSDVDGIINYARDIEGIEVAVLFNEMDENLVKVGFRSKDRVDVSKLAQKFQGGGHKKASGAVVKGNLKEVYSKVIRQVNETLGW